MAKQKVSNKLQLMKILKYEKINVLQEREYTLGETAKIYEYTLEPIQVDLKNHKYYIGIDPGSKNIGISILGVSSSFSLEVRVNPKLTLNSVQKMFILQDIVHALLFIDRTIAKNLVKVVIEGASFGDRFGQVNLAEARTSLIFGLSKGVSINNILIRQPSAIRKAVFGNGFVRGEDVYTNIKHNAAASLVCAISAENF